MAAIINATVGGVSANSYITLAEANAYHESRLNSSTWDVATDDQKNRALITATRLLDEHMTWLGVWTSDEQALAWPRIGEPDDEGYLYDNLGRTIDSNEIPVKLKEATAEFARFLLESDRTADSTEGIASVTVGSIGVSFNQNRPAQRKVIPDAVLEMINQWGEPAYRSSGIVDLMRV